MKQAIVLLFTSVWGLLLFSVAVLAINAIFGAGSISWKILWFGVPCHILADFAGFCNVMLHPSQKANTLVPCYLGIVGLAASCWLMLGFWEGALVFAESWLFGVPGGHFRTIRDLDRLSIDQ